VILAHLDPDMVDHSCVVLDDERLHWRSVKAILHPSERHSFAGILACAAVLAARAHVWTLCGWLTPEAVYDDLPGGAADVKCYAGWNVLQRHCRRADGLSQTDVSEAG